MVKICSVNAGTPNMLHVITPLTTDEHYRLAMTL